MLKTLHPSVFFSAAHMHIFLMQRAFLSCLPRRLPVIAAAAASLLLTHCCCIMVAALAMLLQLLLHCSCHCCSAVAAAPASLLLYHCCCPMLLLPRTCVSYGSLSSRMLEENESVIDISFPSRRVVAQIEETALAKIPF